MGKRYYCDFCDKTILSNVENIKKHNEGNQHQLNRKNYYFKYKGLETILFEEREKKPCLKYFSSGYCAFGDLCRGSHKTKQQIQKLEDLYRLECHKKTKLEEEKEMKIQNRKKKLSDDQHEASDLLTDCLSREEEELLDNYFSKYELPKCLKTHEKMILPPSLAPPSFKDYLNFEPNCWL